VPSRKPSPLPGALRAEARTLFTLAEAAAEGGLLSSTDLAVRWQALVPRCAGSLPLEEAAGDLYALLDEAMRTGPIHPAWIEERWRALEARLK
jgi:hypothetical protein